MSKKAEWFFSLLMWAIVWLAILFVFVGGIAFIIRYGADMPDHRFFKGEPSELKGIHGVIELCKRGHSFGMIQLGVLMLLVIPLFRFFLYGVLFFIQKERFYTLASAFGFIVLFLSLFNFI